MPSKEQIEKGREELYDIVWPLVSDTENKQWTHKAGTDIATTGLVYTGQHKNIGTIWKIAVEVDVTPEQYLKEIIFAGKIEEWCPNVSEYKVIEKGSYDDKFWEINYSYCSRIGPISARDFLSMNYFRINEEDGSLLAMTLATEHPDVKKRSGTVRGEYLPTGAYVVKKADDPKKSILYWMNNTDMKGYVPKTLINMVLSKFMLDFGQAVIARCKKIAEGLS